jgi:hypothetical protein
MDTFSLRCLQCGTIKLMLLTVWAHEASFLTIWTNHAYVACSMEPLSLLCLHHGKRTFDGQYCKQGRFHRHVLTYALIAENTPPLVIAHH